MNGSVSAQRARPTGRRILNSSKDAMQDGSGQRPELQLGFQFSAV